MKLPLYLILGLAFVVGVLVALKSVYAVTVAEQTQGYADNLDTWEALQELGGNLSGTLDKFTFRVRTTASNIDQFDFTALNTRLYDKTTNSSVVPCIPSASDPLSGLSFSQSGVPSGYQDVTIDFSCRGYNFITGNKYLIFISNANMPQFGGKLIRFAASAIDQFTGGGLRYAFTNSSCFPSSYVWNSQNNNNGCNIWNTPNADLYFVLSNTSPPPKLPVIFIPGIGGSELKANQKIFWVEQDDGHGGKFSHAYESEEKIWVNQEKAQELGNDDYFDVLRLKKDGVTSEADLSLTGNLTSHGYSDIESFFTGMGYEKNKNFFIFPYDWRKDVRSNKDSLDNLIETAKTASGQTKVNLVVHSMGGLIGRYYVSDSGKATKVNKLIELGVPHLGAVSGLKALIYGEPVGRWYFKIINIGVNGNEVKDVLRNLPSHHSLLPSKKYFDFYSDYPFRDDRDIDDNKITGNLNYDQTKSLLSNLSYNMTVFGIGEEFHSNLDPILHQTNGTKIYQIVGTAQPTLGQIHETWWITWPVNLISKTDEIYINGDDTVPLYSASLKNDSLDISGATKTHYVEQKHSDLVSSSGTAMQTVKSILDEDNALPVEVKDQKINLEGEQLSLDDGELDLYDDQNRHCGLKDNGELEENIPDVTCTTSVNTKQAFVKKKAAKVKVKVTRKKPATKAKTTNLKKRTYKTDKISKTILYKDIVISDKDTIEFDLDPASDTSPSLPMPVTSEVSGDSAADQTAPKTTIVISGTKNSSGIYDGPVIITLTGSDSGSGILRIEYSLDNGLTVQVYSGPFTISASGKTTIQFKSIDKLGNEEVPQTITIEIAAASTSSSSSSSSESSSSSSSTKNSDATNVSTTTTTVSVSSLNNSASSAVLGVEFANPSHIADQINVERLADRILEEQKNPKPTGIFDRPAFEILGGLLIVSGGIVVVASVALLASFHTSTLSFVKPFPK